MRGKALIVVAAALLVAIAFLPSKAQFAKSDLLGAWQCDSLIVKHYTRSVMTGDTVAHFPDSIIFNTQFTQSIVLDFLPNDTAFIPGTEDSYFIYSIVNDTGYLKKDTITVAFIESNDMNYLRSINPLFTDITVTSWSSGVPPLPLIVDVKDYYAVFVKIPTSVKPLGRTGATLSYAGGQAGSMRIVDLLGRRMHQTDARLLCNCVFVQEKVLNARQSIIKTMHLR